MHLADSIGTGVLVYIIRPLDKDCIIETLFSYFSIKTYVLGAQQDRLNETVLFFFSVSKTYVETDV